MSRKAPDVLREMARLWRFQASLTPPRDYEPTEAELQTERAPLLENAADLEAGAAALDLLQKLVDSGIWEFNHEWAKEAEAVLTSLSTGGQA